MRLRGNLLERRGIVLYGPHRRRNRRADLYPAFVTDFQYRIPVLVRDTDYVDLSAEPTPTATISRDSYRGNGISGTFRSPAGVDAVIRACDTPALRRSSIPG